MCLSSLCDNGYKTKKSLTTEKSSPYIIAVGFFSISIWFLTIALSAYD